MFNALMHEIFMNGLGLRWIMFLLFIILFQKVVLLAAGWQRRMKKWPNRIRLWWERTRDTRQIVFGNLLFGIVCFLGGGIIAAIIVGSFWGIRDHYAPEPTPPSTERVIVQIIDDPTITNRLAKLDAQSLDLFRRYTNILYKADNGFRAIKNEQKTLYSLARSNSVQLAIIQEKKERRGWFASWFGK